ncbi:MAG: SDR family NAD(P)-dependent oxidoreductase, partial [Dehalococcoidia bacterium]|nr:SDR family NAD(P)-dependent oxidoreductase [Dehalococcoidia bacterium]
MLEGLSLEGKVVIVTGGGAGLGKAMAIMLGAAGADIVVAGRRLGPLEEVAAEVKAYGRRALAIPTDISDSDQVSRMVQLVSKNFGYI